MIFNIFRDFGSLEINLKFSGDSYCTKKGNPDDILDLLTKNEEALERLYAAYSERFSNSSELWRGLEAEERTHADSIRELGNRALKGELVFIRDRFKSGAIRNFTANIENEIKSAERPTFTEINALSIAVDIEVSLIEHNFFEIFASDSPILKQTLKQLEWDTQKHAAKLRKRWEQQRKK